MFSQGPARIDVAAWAWNQSAPLEKQIMKIGSMLIHSRLPQVGALLALVLAPAYSPAQTVYENYTFTTLAGCSGYGSADGTGSAARFNGPNSVAVDTAGNIYLADENNHTIRKVTPAGVVTTLAGLAGNPGSADGTGDAARFNRPWGVAVDGVGNLYVADTGNLTIRKVTPNGVVTTLAGLAGSGGSTDGTGSDARFAWPVAVAVDSAGNVFVADYNNNTIRKITPTGLVTTLAGTPGPGGSDDGTGSAASFSQPAGLAVDRADNVYVADCNNDTLRKITPTGVVTTLAGLAGTAGSDDGTGSAARFYLPEGVAVDNAGNIYVAEGGNDMIRKVTSSGVVTTLAGSPRRNGNADGTGSAARFDAPEGVAVDGAGNIYVADFVNNTVRKLTPAGAVTTLAGLAGYGSVDGTGSAARFNWPWGVAADGAGNVFVADTENQTIREVTPAGSVTTLAGTPGTRGTTDGTGSAAQFNYPEDVAVDGAGNAYVADRNNNTIRKVTPSGVVTTLAGSAGGRGSDDGTGSVARFNSPTALAVDGLGNVYVADSGNNTIRKVTPSGVVTTLAGLAGSSGSADGTGNAARFNWPIGVAVDSAGVIYAVDNGNNTIRKIVGAGVVTTLAGLAGKPGIADGTGSAARFNRPSGVAVDGLGNVFVADSGNNTIRKVTPSGVVTTLAGSTEEQGTADGIGSAARFRWPVGLAVDSVGNLYVGDAGNHSIRKGWLAPAPPMFRAPVILADGSVQLNLSCGRGLSYLLQVSTNLVDWAPLQSFTSTNATMRFADPAAAHLPRRFYRALAQ